jgi:hypothetical protein
MSSQKSSRVELLKKLRTLGVGTVTADYDGASDRGQIDDPQFGSHRVPPETHKAVLDLFYDLLEEEHLGWEINEGSYGRFEWDIKADVIRLGHTQRSEEYEETDL